MNFIFAVWFLSEKHFIYIELLFQEFLLSSRFQKCSLSLSHIFIFIRVIEHRKHFWASKVFFQECSLSLPYPLLYILTRIIEHREPPREPCHPRGLDLPLSRMIGPIPPQREIRLNLKIKSIWIRKKNKRKNTIYTFILFLLLSFLNDFETTLFFSFSFLSKIFVRLRLRFRVAIFLIFLIFFARRVVDALSFFFVFFLSRSLFSRQFLS